MLPVSQCKKLVRHEGLIKDLIKTKLIKLQHGKTYLKRQKPSLGTNVFDFGASPTLKS